MIGTPVCTHVILDATLYRSGWWYGGGGAISFLIILCTLEIGGGGCCVGTLVRYVSVPCNCAVHVDLLQPHNNKDYF